MSESATGGSGAEQAQEAAAASIAWKVARTTRMAALLQGRRGARWVGDQLLRLRLLAVEAAGVVVSEPKFLAAWAPRAGQAAGIARAGPWSPLFSIAFEEADSSTFTLKILSSRSRCASCGPPAPPSRPRSSREGTLALPVCSAAPCRARAQCVRGPRCGLGRSAARIPPERGASDWGARGFARHSE